MLWSMSRPLQLFSTLRRRRRKIHHYLHARLMTNDMADQDALDPLIDAHLWNPVDVLADPAQLLVGQPSDELRDLLAGATQHLQRLVSVRVRVSLTAFGVDAIDLRLSPDVQRLAIGDGAEVAQLNETAPGHMPGQRRKRAPLIWADATKVIIRQTLKEPHKPIVGLLKLL